MKRVVFEATCPGCGKRIHAPSAEKREANANRHARNCAALKRQTFNPEPTP